MYNLQNVEKSGFGQSVCLSQTRAGMHSGPAGLLNAGQDRAGASQPGKG